MQCRALPHPALSQSQPQVLLCVAAETVGHGALSGPRLGERENLCDLFLQYDERNCTSIFVSTFALLKVLLPYGGFLSREKTFANFVFLWRFAKVCFLRENLFSSN